MISQKRLVYDNRGIVADNSLFLDLVNLFLVKTKLFLKNDAIATHCVDKGGIDLLQSWDNLVANAVAGNGHIGIGAVDGILQLMSLGKVANLPGGELQHGSEELAVALRNGAEPFESRAPTESRRRFG